MNFLIIFLAVLAVSCAEDAGAAVNKKCIDTRIYNTYQEQISCLSSYMGSVIKSSSAPARRKRDLAPAPESTIDTKTSKPALPTITTPKICSSLDEVKVLFEEKRTNSVRKQQNLSVEIRKEILDQLLQEKRLKEFKLDDFGCIKRTDIKNHLKENCVIEVLKTFANASRIPVRISNILSKTNNITIEEAPCKNSVEVSACVKGALKNCSSTVQKFVGDLDNMISKRCEPLLSMKSTEPVKKPISSTLIIIIVLVSICGSLAAGFGIYNFLKMRRNRGPHTVTRNPPEECEMTSRIKP